METYNVLSGQVLCPTIFSMAWHDRLKQAMVASGLDGRDVARIARIKYPTCMRYLAGLAEPRYAILARLCKAVNVSVAYVLADAPDVGSVYEMAAYESFERALQDRGALNVLALLEGSTQYARDLGEVPLSPRPVSQDKRPNRPQTPPDPEGVPVDPPIRGRGPKKL
jgi:hypothetical protein